MRKVFFIDSVHPKMWSALEEMGYACIDLANSAREEIVELLPFAHGLVIRSRYTLDEEFLSSAQELKWIARSGIGLENIDTDYCEQRGIQVVNAAGGNADAVGEHVIGMLLSLFNHLHLADREIRLGVWQREPNRGLELGHRTIGLIGYGNTGRSVAQKLSGFGCEVLAYDKYAPVDGTYAKAASLEDIKSQCDVLSYHVPLTDETHHYFDAAFLADMKQNFYLVNASRGPVCSSAAIDQGIAEGRILGACLDVLEEEGKDFELGNKENQALTALLDSNKVLFSPHVGGWTVESYEKLADVLIDRVKALE